MSLTHIARLLHERNLIDAQIAEVTDRPMTAGHLGEWIASQLFPIELEKNAANRGYDGRFTEGPLRGKRVNVKWYLKQEGLLDLIAPELLDYYLVFTGPISAAFGSRGTTRPWCITNIFLFDAEQVTAQQMARGVGTGTAASLLQGQWAAAEVYPGRRSELLPITDEQSMALRQFAPLMV
ncbi:hypothetical protein [Cryptosporangium sp. NPDC048952]|uniref:hypothetical protein n=1 Tax=Cryptosporangium sp. NPDC048952 TaxID=3363961 RepID=UPI00371507D6